MPDRRPHQPDPEVQAQALAKYRAAGVPEYWAILAAEAVAKERRSALDETYIRRANQEMKE